MTTTHWQTSRRTLMQAAAATGTISAFGLGAMAQKAGPTPSFKPWPIKKGVNSASTPFGMVRVGIIESQCLPVYVESADRSAVFDAEGKAVLTRIGAGSNAITFTGGSIQLGKGAKLIKLDRAGWKSLIAYAGKDSGLLASAMGLRSALMSAFPIAVLASRTKPYVDAAKQTLETAAEMAEQGANCTVSRWEEEVETRVVELVDVVVTAEKQWNECIAKAKCDDGLGGVPCYAAAVAVCSAKTFLDLVVGTIEIVTKFVDTIVHETVVCVTGALPKGVLPNEWFASKGGFAGLLETPAQAASFGSAQVLEALAFLKTHTAFLGEFATCFLNSKWQLAQSGTIARTSGGALSIPYGIKITMSATCARKLKLESLWGQAFASVSSLLALIAAIDAPAKAVLAPLGIAATPAVVAAAGSLGAVVLQIATLIACFLVVAIWHGVMLSAQLSLADAAGAFADGKVEMIHPTFVLALLEAVTLGFSPGEFVPPIVVG